MDFVSKLCDRVILLDGGKVAADGKTNLILSDKALLEKHGLLE